MSYQFIDRFNSPNYSTPEEARGIWGRNRTIEKIAIHWWDDPLNNPSFQGTINTLCNPAREASAHFVVTGTNRQVACLVAIPNVSWATNSANPYTISIECDPRCRPEDYDVVAELVAELRAEYGNLPLMRHSDVQATRCPGNYILDHIDAVAATKIADKNLPWGQVVNKPVPTPPPVPAPTPTPVPFVGYKVFVDGVQVGAYKVDKNAYQKWVDTGRKGAIKDQTGVDVTIAIVSRFEPPAPTPVPTPIPTEVDKSQNDRIGAIEAQLSTMQKLLNAIIAFLENLPAFKK